MNAERLYENARAEVTRLWGRRAWSQLGGDIRQGLIAHKLLVILDEQDQAISPEVVRDLLHEFRDHLIGESA